MKQIIENYVSLLINKLEEYNKETKSILPVDKVEIEMGKKFAKIVKRRSAYAFIALEDSETKTLGKVTKGDLLIPASWKSPAKHARGNILKDMNGAVEVSGIYGVQYLK